jgi:antitoxin MazE
MQVRVAKWGNSLGLRVPKDVAARVGLREGSRVEIAARGSSIIVTVDRPVFDLCELLEDMTPEAMHEAFDWGEDVGREVVE